MKLSLCKEGIFSFYLLPTWIGFHHFPHSSQEIWTTLCNQNLKQKKIHNQRTSVIYLDQRTLNLHLCYYLLKVSSSSFWRCANLFSASKVGALKGFIMLLLFSLKYVLLIHFVLTIQQVINNFAMRITLWILRCWRNWITCVNILQKDNRKWWIYNLDKILFGWLLINKMNDALEWTLSWLWISQTNMKSVIKWKGRDSEKKVRAKVFL
jgi:hypothetical protein